MSSTLNYKSCTPCQIEIADLASQDEVALTLGGAGGVIWAICRADLAGESATTIATAADDPLSQVSMVHITRDTVSIRAALLKSLARHGGPGPQISPLIVRLYLWAQDTQKISLQRAGAVTPAIGFAFGHSESVSDWVWVDVDGISIDWPTLL